VAHLFATKTAALPVVVPVAANDNEPVFVDPTSWDRKPVPERLWYLPDLIPSRTVTILAGDGGVGKSLLALQLAITSALDLETLGLKPTACHVIYVGAEDEVDEFHRRIDGILRAHDVPYSDLEGGFLLLSLADKDATLASPDAKGVMLPTPLMGQLIDKAVEFEPGLIVLDTSADLYGGDEIKRSQVRGFVAMLRSIAMKVDCAIVLLQHPSVAGMQSGAGTSGSTAWNNSVRSRLYLTSAEDDLDGRVLKPVKANYGKKADAINLRWHKGTFVLDDGTAPNPAKGLLEKRTDTLFIDLLRKLNRQGLRVSPNPSPSHAPRVMVQQPEAKGTTKRELTEALQRLLDRDEIRIIEEGPPSRRYKRLIVSADDSRHSNSGFELPSNSSD